MIFQTDALLRVLLKTIITDIKKDLWLLDYILDDFTNNQFLKNSYGKKQIAAAKEWFADNRNEISITQQFSKDKDKFPQIVLALGSSSEVQDLRVLADIDAEDLVLMPNQVGQPIPYVIQPAVPLSYDQAAGLVTMPVGTDLQIIAPGMVLVNPSDGNGVIIQGITDGAIQIQPNTTLDASLLGVIPQYRFFTTKLGRSFFEENWTMVIAANDPQTLLWMHSIIVFGLLRYREFLESNGFLETKFTSTDIFNPEFSNAGGEEIFCRQITMTGKVQQQFIRGLHRTIESVILRDIDPAAASAVDPQGFVGGIKIVSSITTPLSQQNDCDWFTISKEDAAKG